MKTVRLPLFLSLVLLAASVSAQENAAYVTRLTAQAGPTSVLLTWKDAEGWPGAKYEVWRSEKEIVKDSLAQAKLLGVVDSGVEAYEDTTVSTDSFYLVLLKDADGTRRSFYVPYRNKTLTAVKPEAAAQATARIKVGAVAYANPQVLIPFTAYPPEKKLVVFRRAAPIASMADLKDATLLGNTTGAQAPYKDTPAPGLEFYYAILDAQAFADGKPDAFQVDNTTDRPAGFPLVTVPVTQTGPSLDASLRPGIDSTRALPLPRLLVETDPSSGMPLASTAYEPVEALPLPPEVAAVLKAWTKGGRLEVTVLPDPVVLPEERSAANTGAGRYLVQIQKAYLESKDWKGAIAALESVLKLELEPRVEARARFYRGEALAYLKQYRPAFLEFLAAREAYPEETTPFLEALFSLLGEVTD